MSPLTVRNFEDNEKFRPMSECADYAGGDGSILFPNPVSILFTGNGSTVFTFEQQNTNLMFLY